MTKRKIFEFIGGALDAKDPIDAVWQCLVGTIFQNKENLSSSPEVTLSPEALNIYLVLAFDFEVQNGGFHQFFYNASGNFTAETIDALRRVGADAAANLLQDACKAFPMSKPSKDGKLRYEELSRLDLEVFSSYDDFYYKDIAPSQGLEDGRENLWKPLMAYIRANSECKIRKISKTSVLLPD
jgi:hypothetical protein